jgi:hypothetical protein
MTTTPDLVTLFCDRCGKRFQFPRLVLECPPCMYATAPWRVVLGYAQPTPLITPIGVA